ncbi:hypothetical protein BASA81_003783 [Batrachochytrium salamandrivorans]|nr:hypothetical protein BASA81_003783 [Batrachochytrium salamandrivorans]
MVGRTPPSTHPLTPTLCNAALVLTVLHEQQLGESSKHSIYLSLLDPELVPLPKFWSVEELALLQDDSVIAEFTQQADELLREFHRLKAALRRHARRELDEYVNLDRFYWACGIVQSRSFESVNSTNALIPVADLLNSHPTNYVAWSLREDGVDGYQFGTFPHRGIPRGEQVFNMYGGGEHNLHTMGEYGYIPFPNPLNFQELHMDQVTSTNLEYKLDLLGSGVQIHFKVQGPTLMEFFQIASSTSEEQADSSRSWQSERDALSLCVSAFRGMLDAMGTTVGEDYQWLHNPKLPYRTRLAVMFRIDSKALLTRNLQFCERVQSAMSCWTGRHPQSLVSRWSKPPPPSCPATAKTDAQIFSGSQEHKDARKGAAQSEKEFVGAGQKPGLEVWRVENRRTKSDTPDFGVKRWPKEEYGSFFSGDSYLVLNTYKVKVDGKETDKLAWDVHFWLGRESSQDEIGVAAYKAVELDDLLDDGPVQHREVQGSESPLFQAYFPSMQYLEGGIASGFRQVKPEEYVPRLFQIRQSIKAVRATEVPVSAKSLNDGDVFILDAGKTIYTFVGTHASSFEKSKAGALAHNMVAGRQGKSKIVNDQDENFWSILKGTIADVSPPLAEKPAKEEEAIDADKLILYQLSDASGSITFTKKAEGKITIGMFDSNDVFILDGRLQIFVWVGRGASHGEKSQAMKFATEYMKKENRPLTIPVTRISEGQINNVFSGLVH